MQFSQAELPPLPDRAALYDAAPLTEADFSAEELRLAKKKMKKKRASGSDTLSVEFVLCLLSIPEGFTFILALFNQCWRTETIPELWQLGRIAAIYKKGKNCQLPASYRPISILQVLYKLYTTLILGRLSGGMKAVSGNFSTVFRVVFR